MGKGPTYGEFTFPKGDVTYVRGYARGGTVKSFSGGGPVNLPTKPAAGPNIPKPSDSVNIPKPKDSLKKPVTFAGGGPAPQPVPGGGVGGSGKLLGELMGQPKKNEIGKDSRKYARGGAVHPDLKEDKALIKKAFGMHDTQLHESKRTNLSTLKKGGMVHGYAKGGMTKQKPSAVMKPRGAHAKGAGAKSAIDPAALQGVLGQIASAGGGGPMMKVGGQVKKPGLNLSPKARADMPPKTVNVKARMGLGSAGSPENLKRGGFVKK